MSDLISVGKTNATPKSYLDMSRPLTMVAADPLFRKVTRANGESPKDMLEIAGKLSAALTTTKKFDMETLWPKLEKVLNDGKKLDTASKTDTAKLQTAFSMFYNILNSIDGQATSTQELFEFQNLFLNTQDHVVRRILPGQSGKDKRNIERIVTTIGERLGKVVERFNARIDAGEISGFKL